MQQPAQPLFAKTETSRRHKWTALAASSLSAFPQTEMPASWGQCSSVGKCAAFKIYVLNACKLTLLCLKSKPLKCTQLHLAGTDFLPKKKKKKSNVCMKICRKSLGNKPKEGEWSGQKGTHPSAWRGPGAPAEPRHCRQAGCSTPAKLRVNPGTAGRLDAAPQRSSGSPAQTCFRIHSGKQKLPIWAPESSRTDPFSSQWPSPTAATAGPERGWAGPAAPKEA